MGDVALSTEAVVEGFTAVMYPPPGALVEAPYAIIAAGFDEGVTVLGVGVGILVDELAIGDRVECIATMIGDAIGFGFRFSKEPLR